MTAPAPHRPVTTLKAIHEDPALVVLRAQWRGVEQPGPPVIVFGSGSDEVRAGRRHEFLGTMTALGRAWLFVVDRERSFYAQPGMADRIAALALDEMQRTGSAFVDTLGQSMGSFGAVGFATRLPVRVALAFGPRYSPDSRIVPDPRFDHILPRFHGRFPFPTLDAWLRAAGQAVVLYGDRGPDLAHHVRLSAPPGAIHRILRGVGHDLPHVLRTRGQLFALIQTALSADRAALDAVLEEIGFRDPGRLRLRERLRLAARPLARVARRLLK